MLWAEGRGQLQFGQGGQRVEGVRQIGGDRGRVGEQGKALAAQWLAQVRFGEQTVETGEKGHGRTFRAGSG